MKRTCYFHGIVAIVLTCCASQLWAANASQMNYQGFLTRNGSPVTTSTSVLFTIYDALTGGNSKWSETRTVTPGTDGSFSIVLGEVTAINDTVFRSNSRWLSVKVGTDPEMSPRTRLTSSPSSFRCASIDGAAGGTISGDLNVNYGSALAGTYTTGVDFYRLQLLGSPIWKGGLELTDYGSTQTMNLKGGTACDLWLNSGGGNISLGSNTGLGTRQINLYGGRTIHWGTVEGYSAVTNQVAFEMESNLSDGSGTIWVTNGNHGGHATVQIIGSEGSTGGQISIGNAAGTQTIILDGEYGAGGKGRITTPVLEITGGADFSEQFDLSCKSSVTPQPGMVVAIDPECPGLLKVCDRAYDRRVAGIVSGAGNVEPGLLMGQRGSIADGKFPVALTGRVYCLADASHGAIEPGDMLTTSDTPGHAMKATNTASSNGSIIGKAMTSLKEGRGFILVLVTLQ